MNSDDAIRWNEGSSDFQDSKTSQGFGLSVEEGLEIPELFKLFGDMEGKSAVDLGCGDGNLTSRIAALTGSVTGVDGSSEQIARAKVANPNINFIISDLNKRFPFNDSELDLVISRFLLMYINDLDHIAFETRRILKPEGKLIFTITHPFYPYIQKLTATAHRYKGLNMYSERIKGEMKFDNAVFPFYFRPIEDYIDPFIKVDLFLEAFKEIIPTEELIKSNPSIERMAGKPVFLILGFRK